MFVIHRGTEHGFQNICCRCINTGYRCIPVWITGKNRLIGIFFQIEHISVCCKACLRVQSVNIAESGRIGVCREEPVFRLECLKIGFLYLQE